MTNSFVSGIVGTLILLTTQLACAGDQTLQINDPWIREAPPNAKALAAYMIIDNQSSQQRTLIAATCSAFKKVEIHRSLHRDGMMSMEQQHELIIAANDQKILAPGGYHLMLMHPKQTLKEGDQVDLILQFANGEELTLTTPVKRQLK
ncbi:MAG TPA: copper chaperone PCu(A)C [Gammaproteobacteria bacterium]|nr:copper chaperone PCu(A)C [Gammaproteobacteria bacterium]